MGIRDSYRLGASAEVGQAIEEWTLFTPAIAQQRLDQIRSSARALSADVAGYVPQSGHELRWSQWAKQYGDWLAQLDAYQPDWLDRAFGNTATLIEGYARQLDDWRKAFAQWPGARLTAPGPGVAEDQREKPQGFSRLAAVGIGAAAALSIVALVLVARGGGK